MRNSGSLPVTRAALGARHNVNTFGRGPLTLVFVHGFGCNQTMWRYVAPALAKEAQVVAYDLMGCGLSDFAQYRPARYETLEGHAEDLLQVVEAFTTGPVVVVSHSVGSMIALSADLLKPNRIRGHAMITPSPCYLNQGDYRGGFEPAEIDALLAFIAQNGTEWPRTLSRLVVGDPAQSEFVQEMFLAFCKTDARAALQFARATFLSDHRDRLADLAKPALLLQCTQDALVPREVGEFMRRQVRNSSLKTIDQVGHSPHLLQPETCVTHIREFLHSLGW